MSTRYALKKLKIAHLPHDPFDRDLCDNTGFFCILNPRKLSKLGEPSFSSDILHNNENKWCTENRWYSKNRNVRSRYLSSLRFLYYKLYKYITVASTHHFYKTFDTDLIHSTKHINAEQSTFFITIHQTPPTLSFEMAYKYVVTCNTE